MVERIEIKDDELIHGKHCKVAADKRRGEDYSMLLGTKALQQTLAVRRQQEEQREEEKRKSNQASKSSLLIEDKWLSANGSETLEKVGSDGTPIRKFSPLDPLSSKGHLIHFHGGGWVFNSHRSSDEFLTRIALEGITVVSIGYKLAKENEQDYNDVFKSATSAARSYIQGQAKRRPVVLGGESAGAHLAIRTYFELREEGLHTNICGLSLLYGVYDMAFDLAPRNDGVAYSKSMTDAFKTAGNTQPHAFAIKMWLFRYCLLGVSLPFDQEAVRNRLESDPTPTALIELFRADLALQTSRDEWFRRLLHPKFSPVHRVFKATLGPLPPAQFIVGEADPLKDDSDRMAEKWEDDGGKSQLITVLNGWHGVLNEDPKQFAVVLDGWKRRETFIKKALEDGLPKF